MRRVLATAIEAVGPLVWLAVLGGAHIWALIWWNVHPVWIGGAILVGAAAAVYIVWCAWTERWPDSTGLG